jgi:hypothetical protein
LSEPDCIKTPWKSSRSKNVHQAGQYILIMAETYRVPQGLVEEILAVKEANILLSTSYHSPRDKLMERARWYQASLEAMYINDHQHVGRLIHPDHRCNLQTLLSQYYEDILDM